MSKWPSRKAKIVFKALLRIGWKEKKRSGTSHIQLEKPGFGDYTWAFHESDEIGPVMMKKIAKHTGLTIQDL